MTSSVVRLVLGAAWLVVSVLHPELSSAETLQERVAAAQRRWAEYQEMMDSSDPIARAESFSAALADENLGIRNNALWSLLQRRDQLPINVVFEPGGRIGPGELPDIQISQMRWDPAQRTFKGTFRSHGYLSRAGGVVTEGKLQVSYDHVRMPARFGQGADIPLTDKDFVLRNCTVVLSINPTDMSLGGPLRCEGMVQTLPLRMPVG